MHKYFSNVIHFFFVCTHSIKIATKQIVFCALLMPHSSHFLPLSIYNLVSSCSLMFLFFANIAPLTLLIRESFFVVVVNKLGTISARAPIIPECKCCGEKHEMRSCLGKKIIYTICMLRTLGCLSWWDAPIIIIDSYATVR